MGGGRQVCSLVMESEDLPPRVCVDLFGLNIDAAVWGIKKIK